jgi:hypothetical protein
VQDQERYRTTIGNTIIDGPVHNERCPACGNADSIYRETDRPTYTLERAAADAMLGTPMLVGMLLARPTIRMRCAECDCRFPGRMSPVTRALIVLLLLAVVTIVAWIAYLYRAPIKAWLIDQWHQNPPLFIGMASVLGSAVLLISFVVLYPSRKPPGSST